MIADLPTSPGGGAGSALRECKRPAATLIRRECATTGALASRAHDLVRAGLAVARRLDPGLVGAVLLTVWGALSSPAAHPEAAGRPPPAQPAVSGAALLADLDALHARLQVHIAYRAGRESWLDVGVHPLPGRPRR